MSGVRDWKGGKPVFDWVEYSVFCSMLILSLLIGGYYGWVRRQHTVAEYMLGGKKMSVYPVGLSLVFSHISVLTFLAVPPEIYSYGTQYCALFVCIISIQYIITYLYLPVFFNLQLNSVYEYLELRFSKDTRTLASSIFALSLLVLIPMLIYVPSLAFNEVTGVPIHVIAPIISCICIFYTLFGGLKAVIWTDTLQSIFTVGSFIFITVRGFLKFDDMLDVFRINIEGRRIEWFDMNPSPFKRNTFWTMFIGQTFYWTGYFAVHPGSVQRFVAVSTLKEAKKVMWCSTLCSLVVTCLVVLVGLLLYATYHDCDPLASNMVQKPDQILPMYVMSVAKDFPGLTGLFISGVVSAALSTMSAGLNTVSGTIYEDIVKFVLKGKKQSEKKQKLTIKIIISVLGILCISLVFLVEKLGALYQMAVSLLGIANGTLAGIFSLGLFFPRANAKGAIWGSVCSIVGVSLLVIGTQYHSLKGHIKYPGKYTSIDGCPFNVTSNLAFNSSTKLQTYRGIGSPVVADSEVPLAFQTSYQYYPMVGTLIVFVVGLSVSYLTKEPPPHCQDPKLFSPFVRRFLPKDQARERLAVQYKVVNTQSVPQDENCTLK